MGNPNTFRSCANSRTSIYYIYIYIFHAGFSGYTTSTTLPISINHRHQPKESEEMRIHWDIWVFPKIGVPQNGWFIMKNPIKMDDLGVPLFSETSIYLGDTLFFSVATALAGPRHIQAVTHLCKQRDKRGMQTITGTECPMNSNSICI